MPELDTRYGRLTVLDAETDIIGHFLARYGEWAWDEASFVASLLRDGARVLDVGAFAGTFGLGVAQSRNLGFLCLVEANPAAARLLEGNVTGQAGCPVVVVEALVAGPGAHSRAGHNEAGNLGSMSFCLDSDAADTVPAPVRAVTLAELRAEHGAFDLIKLDIEGMELEALQGDADYLAQGQTTLWIECNEDRRSLDVARLLLSWRLDLFYFAFPSYNPDNFNGDPKAVFPWAFEAGLLAAPMVSPSLTADLAAKGCILKPLRSVDDLRDALWRTPRWGVPEWEGTTTREELAAVMSRSLRSESFDEFLRADGPAVPDKGPTVWQQLEAAEAGLKQARLLIEEERGQRVILENGLRQASDLAFARLDEIAEERERRERAEDGLRTAERLAFERFDLLNAEQERREHLEGRLRQAEALAARRLAEANGERDRAGCAEAELARASARALAHLSELGKARDQLSTLKAALRAERAAVEAERLELHEALDTRVRAHEERVREAQYIAATIQNSTVWRVSAPARAFVGRKPALRAVLRRGRAAAGSMLRRLRR